MSDELTRTAFRKHPVTQVLAAAASGGLPSELELDDLRLPSAARRKLAETCIEVAAIRASGENAEARGQADAVAETIVRGLEPALRNPDYLRPADETPDDPAGLASRVTRW